MGFLTYFFAHFIDFCVLLCGIFVVAYVFASSVCAVLIVVFCKSKLIFVSCHLVTILSGTLLRVYGMRPTIWLVNLYVVLPIISSLRMFYLCDACLCMRVFVWASLCLRECLFGRVFVWASLCSGVSLFGRVFVYASVCLCACF